MRRRNGFSLMEVILATCVLAVAMVSLLAVFSGGARHAVQTRNRTAAIMLAQSLGEEVQGHTYGAAAPTVWPVDTPRPVSYDVWVEGKRQKMDFLRTVTFANGSCIGKGPQSWDRATITVTWEEIDAVAAGGKREQKKLVTQTTVWRVGAVK